MKRTHLLKCLAFLSILYLTSCCRPELIGSVPNSLRPQQTANWCWAAVTQMLSQHLGLSITQCDLANHRFGKTNCCNNQAPVNSDQPCLKTNDCNIPGWVDLDFAGATSSQSETALSWAKIKSQVYCTKKPMGYAYGTPGIVGHVVVIKAYVTVGGTDYVVLNDPWSPCQGVERILEYSEYVNPSGSSTHWNTWYDIRKK